jgi:uncharacterized protein YbaP (TraB family)
MRFLLNLLLFVGTGLAFAQPAPRDVAAQADAPALWKISGPRGNVYFFGSFHMLPPDVKWRTPALQKALNEAGSVVLETDLAGLQDPQTAQALITQFGMLQGGQTLAGVLGPRAYADVEKTAAGLQVPPGALSSFRPWLAGTMLAVMSIARLGFDPAAGVDHQLADWANANGKALRSLESNQAQFQVFADLTPAQEAEFLAVTLRQIGETPRLLKEMLTAYRRGDTADIERTINAGFDDFPALRERLLKQRHDKWLPQIEKMISQGGNHLVVVGAAHLVGPDSVVAMLRAKGIKIEGP